MSALRLEFTQARRGEVRESGTEHGAGWTAKHSANSFTDDGRGHPCDTLQHRRGALDEPADSAESSCVNGSTTA